MTVENGRKLKPTNLGIVLVHGYYKTGVWSTGCGEHRVGGREGGGARV